MTIEFPQTPAQKKPNAEEQRSEFELRPTSLEHYVGQETLKRSLHVLLGAAKKRNESADHLLFYGPPGLGKTTLAHIIARELNVNIQATSGPALEKVGDLGAILTNMKPGDVLFIDEIHRLNKLVEEALYPAMEDYKLDIVLGQGPSAKTVQLELPRFTLIGATTRFGMLTKPLRDRFGFTSRLEFYKPDEVAKIIQRSATIFDLTIHDSAAMLFAHCARQTPRIANRLLRRARDIAHVDNTTTIDEAIAHRTLQMLEIDQKGLGPMDREILNTIITSFQGGPVGLATLASALAEEQETIEDVHEPFLIQLGMLAKTPRGRTTTDHAHNHLQTFPQR